MFACESYDPNQELIENDTELRNLEIGDRMFVVEHDRRLALRQLRRKQAKEPPVEEVTSFEIWSKWKVGDHCRALYPEDNLWYEAKIIAIQGDKCTIDYIGFDEEAEMKLNRLDQSLGKKERERQRAVAKEYLANNGNKNTKGNGAKNNGNGAKNNGNGAKNKDNAAKNKDNAAKNKDKAAKNKSNENKSKIASPHPPHQGSDHNRPNETQKLNRVAENDFNNPHPVATYQGKPPVNKTTKGNDAKNKSEIASPRHPHRMKSHYRPNETRIFNRDAENDFNNPYPVAIYPRMPPVAIPAALPMSELPNSSLYAMVSSWYMAGYYTGINQARKGSFQQHCCCCQNCC